MGIGVCGQTDRQTGVKVCHAFPFSDAIVAGKRFRLTPDRPFNNFRASRSGDQLILCRSETSSDGFRSSQVVKGSVGQQHPFFVCLLFQNILGLFAFLEGLQILHCTVGRKHHRARNTQPQIHTVVQIVLGSNNFTR